MRTTARILPTLALVAALGACGNEGPAKISTSGVSPTTAPTGDPGGGGLPAVGDAPMIGGGGGGGGGGEEEPSGPPLKLVAVVKKGAVERGEPIVVRVELQNLGKSPLGLLDVGTELAQGLFVQVNEGAGEDGKPLLRGYGKIAPTSAKPQLTRLAPGEMFATDVDLQPLLERSPAYEGGEMDFAVLFRGKGKRVTGGDFIWNPEGKSMLVSGPCEVDVTQPEWAMGEEDDEEGPAGAAWNVALFYRKGTPKGDETEKELAKFDAKQFRGLAAVVRYLKNADAKRSVVAGNALRLLRLGGAKANRAMQDVDPGTDVAVGMAKTILADDHGGTPSRERLAAGKIASGKSGAWLRVRDNSVEGGTSVVYTLTDDRFLMLTEGAGENAKTTARQLSNDEISGLREMAVASSMWNWTPVRDARRKGEGTVSFQLGEKAGVLVSVKLLADEATRDNPFAADLVRGLREVRENDPTKPRPEGPPKKKRPR